MIALLVPWRFSAIPSVIRLRAVSSSAMGFPRTSSQKNHHLERMNSHAYGRVGGHEFLHHGSLDLVWSVDLYYILFLVQLASRKVHVASVTPYPGQLWMAQVARNVTMADWGFLTPG
jgi:hypothetical protein